MKHRAVLYPGWERVTCLHPSSFWTVQGWFYILYFCQDERQEITEADFMCLNGTW